MHFSSLDFRSWLIDQKGLMIFQMYFQEQTTIGSQLDMTESPFLSPQQIIDDLHLKDSGLSTQQWVIYFSFSGICLANSFILFVTFQWWKQNVTYFYTSNVL
jgi:hypothetical protein